MSERKQIHREFLTGERALFASNDLDIYDTIFDDGESPLKESHGISDRLFLDGNIRYGTVVT